jgi:hypothetical protein
MAVVGADGDFKRAREGDKVLKAKLRYEPPTHEAPIRASKDNGVVETPGNDAASLQEDTAPHQAALGA